VKGQGHTVTKTVVVAQLLVTRAATDVAGVGLPVDMTSIYLRPSITRMETYSCLLNTAAEISNILHK